MRIVFADDGPHVVLEETPITVPIDVKVGKKWIFDQAGYVALKTRPATEAELESWRYGE